MAIGVASLRAAYGVGDEHLAQGSPDLLRELMGGFIDTRLPADADSVCGASYGSQDSAETLDVALPKLREGPTS